MLRCALHINSGRIILYFAFVAACGPLQTHFHERGRGGKRQVQRRFLRKRGAAVGGLALSVIAARCHLSQRERPWHSGKVTERIAKSPVSPEALPLGELSPQVTERARTLAASSLPLGGAVAQRLRGYKSAEPEKTVKRSSRRIGVNLQFFPVGAHFFRIVKGE